MQPGARLRKIAEPGAAAAVAGVVSGYAAMLAAQAGLPAVYVSGGATAAAKGLPDLGAITAADIAAVVAEAAAAAPLPILADADTGFGNVLALRRTVRTIEAAGAAGLHLEDQETEGRRCGHRPGKRLCPPAQMADRLRAACDARRDDAFVIMARTDAIGPEGLEAALERAAAYAEAGADMVFLEGATDPKQYRAACAALPVPVLANMTEFGVTPLQTRAQLADLGVALALYPLSAFRMMMRAAAELYRQLAEEGSQQGCIEAMQTRAELYANLDYEEQERKLDGGK